MLKAWPMAWAISWACWEDSKLLHTLQSPSSKAHTFKKPHSF